MVEGFEGYGGICKTEFQRHIVEFKANGSSKENFL